MILNFNIISIFPLYNESIMVQGGFYRKGKQRMHKK